MPIVEYYNGTVCKYLTIEETLIENGNRHYSNAIGYASAGYPDRYFEGSMRKAKKNWDKADKFKIPIQSMVMFEAINERIAFSIMNGSEDIFK